MPLHTARFLLKKPVRAAETASRAPLQMLHPYAPILFLHYLLPSNGLHRPFSLEGMAFNKSAGRRFNPERAPQAI